MPRFILITGTDTGVGKTVIAALLCRQLVETGVRVAALKPVCSGGREDAGTLHAAMGGALPLDEINPWHFRAPVAPMLAARLEGEQVELPEVVEHCRRMARRHDVVLVEGAGGLLSPLGERFDSRDLLLALEAVPVVVFPLRLGAINQTRLVFEALPAQSRKRAQLMMMCPAVEDEALARSRILLSSYYDPSAFHSLQHLHQPDRPALALAEAGVRMSVKRLAERVLA